MIFGSLSKPYVIAEIGANHNGDMKLAAELIKAAKDAGADCVKFKVGQKSQFSQRSNMKKIISCRMITVTDQISHLQK